MAKKPVKSDSTDKPSTAKSPKNKTLKKVVEDNQTGARKAILEDLFYDFNRSRAQVFSMNFFRGLFFGLGSALGATLLVAIAIWLLGQFGNIFPPIADFINGIVDAMKQRQ